MMRYKIWKEKVRDIEPMIEDGENVERNSSEEIESQGVCVCVCVCVEHMHVLLKLYIFINLVIY